jgi:uncharacterized heparinase superfamily protein
LGGYAVYKTADWVAATGYNNGAGLLYDAAAPEPLLFLPAAGYRTLPDGGIINIIKVGFYWSSTVSGTAAWRLAFTDKYVDVSEVGRALGFSVRCVKSN